MRAIPLKINLQLALNDENVPDKTQLQLWANAAATACQCAELELTIRVTDIEESAELNNQYRHKAGPTNVLSFPFEDPPGIETGILGDLVICAPVVQREADEQNKQLNEHWAHMLVHGVLHLCGYDHADESSATEMESLETRVITGLGFPPPYSS